MYMNFSHFSYRKVNARALEEFLSERFDRSFLRLECKLARKIPLKNFKVASSPLYVLGKRK